MKGNPDRPIIWPAAASIEHGRQTQRPGFTHTTSWLSSEAHTGRLLPLDKTHRPGWEWTAPSGCIFSEECPLVFLRAQHTKRSQESGKQCNQGVALLSDTDYSGVSSDFMQRRRLCFGRFCCSFGSTSIHLSVTLIFLMQATAARIFFLQIFYLNENMMCQPQGLHIHLFWGEIRIYYLKLFKVTFLTVLTPRWVMRNQRCAASL